MTKAPKNVVASVLARLRNVAQEASLSFNDILQSYVIERFTCAENRNRFWNRDPKIPGTALAPMKKR